MSYEAVWHDDPIDTARVDVRLWAVRLYKTRSAASAACRAAHVRVNHRAAKASTPVKVGDRIEAFIERERVVEIVAVIDKRVGAGVAATCLVDHSPPAPLVRREPPMFRRDRGESAWWRSSVWRRHATTLSSPCPSLACRQTPRDPPVCALTSRAAEGKVDTRAALSRSFQHALVISTQGDIGEVSAGLLRSLDPTFFIGVSTNALFAAVLVFVSSSAGAAPFAYPVACTASLMGVAVLLAIATYLRRLSFPPAVAAPASP